MADCRKTISWTDQSANNQQKQPIPVHLQVQRHYSGAVSLPSLDQRNRAKKLSTWMELTHHSHYSKGKELYQPSHLQGVFTKLRKPDCFFLTLPAPVSLYNHLASIFLNVWHMYYKTAPGLISQNICNNEQGTHHTLHVYSVLSDRFHL